MSDNITMARPGTSRSRDGISLSWPTRPGEDRNARRQVITLPAAKRPQWVKQAITDGAIVETDLPATAPGPTNIEQRTPLSARLMAGGSRKALETMAIPAGPVVRRVFVPAGEIEERTMGSSPPPRGHGPAPAPEPSPEEKVAALMRLNRAELESAAESAGVQGADDLPNKRAIAEAIVAQAETEAEATDEATEEGE